MNAVKKLFEADHKYFDLKEISSQEYEKMIAPLRDVESVVRCKDCKHRPTQKKCFPDMVCPCQCSDSYYSWVPPDDWYCADGERKEGDGDGN